MKLYSHLIRCIPVVCLIIPFSAGAYSLSEEAVNQYLAQKNGIADKFELPGLLSINYSLQDLTSKIGRTDEKRFEINGLIDSIFRFSQQSFAGKINLAMDTVPYYDAAKGQVYLKDVRILNWSVNPPRYAPQLEAVMPFLSENISALLNNTPVYTLDETNPEEALIKKFAKGIKVEEGRLELDAGAF